MSIQLLFHTKHASSLSCQGAGLEHTTQCGDALPSVSGLASGWYSASIIFRPSSFKIISKSCSFKFWGRNKPGN